jgi:hypothetical protein
MVHYNLLFATPLDEFLSELKRLPIHEIKVPVTVVTNDLKHENPNISEATQTIRVPLQLADQKSE